MRLPLVLSAIAIAAASSLGVAGASTAANTEALGRPPSPNPYDGPVVFAGTFADKRWGGQILIWLTRDGRTLTSASGIAPGTCEDDDFGATTPGRNGASGAEFMSYRGFAAPLRGDGSFSKANLRTTRGPRGPKLTGTFSIKGTFVGDVLRGRLAARSATDYDTCTANIGFTARRISK